MTVFLTKQDEEVISEELEYVGSHNHSYTQVQLVVVFHELGYAPMTELSLDTSALPDVLRRKYRNELIPDVSVYPQRRFLVGRDVLRTKDVPLLAVEILSPVQSVQTLVDKVEAYFELGVESCWIVYPYSKSIVVYQSPTEYESFFGRIHDKTLKIEFSLDRIFA